MNHHVIDLRSDTVTRPTLDMRKAIYIAEVGDDAYGEDKASIALKEYCINLFGVEDALFVTSGMLANRLAVCTQVMPGEEVILERNYHVHVFDSAPMAGLFGCVLHPLTTRDGIIRVGDVIQAINLKQRFHHFSQPKLIIIENTINGLGGKIYPFDEIKKLRQFTKSLSINLHMDGARLFNAHVATGISLKDYAAQVDTLSVCFSKGLGAPFGSMLMGSKEIIEAARKFKVWLGSGYHQIGFMAAGALHALKHHNPWLTIDHEHALLLAQELSHINEIEVDPTQVETNMVLIKLGQMSAQEFTDQCRSYGLLVFPWSAHLIRLVTHMGVTPQDIKRTIYIIKKVVRELCKNT